MRAHLAVVVLLVSACGGGTGTPPPERPQGAIEGVVFDAPVAGATVRAYSFTNGTRGTLLGEALTNPSGAFSISFTAPDDVVLVESTGGSYREAASGRDITVAPDVPMRTLIQYTSGAQSHANVTFFTTLASGYAEFLIAGGRAPAAAVSDAFGALNGAIGLDIRATNPADITQVSEATTGVSARHEYGFFAAAVSQWTADASAANGAPVHTTYTSASFLKLAYDDIRTDGKLDGKAGNTALKVGSINLTVDSYRQELSMAILKIVNTGANKTGLRASQLLPAANRWNNSTGAFFGPGPVRPLNPLGPTLSGLAPAAGATVTGTFTASVNAADPDGVAEVQFFIDSALAGTAADPAHPSVQINSQAYANGSHTLRATAKNSIGGSSSIEHQVTINNIASIPKDTTPPTATITAPANGATVKNNTTVTGTASDNVAVASSTFLLNSTTLGNDGTPTAPRKSFNTKSFADGVYTLTLRATDSSGNVTNVTRTITINN